MSLGKVGGLDSHPLRVLLIYSLAADLPYNEWGELLLRGPQVQIGCFEEESTSISSKDSSLADMEKEKWLYTGDMAKIDEDGNLFLKSKVDVDLLKAAKHLLTSVEPSDLDFDFERK
jgi:acyl-CoA synthetase (AMP-forming)/AMP-acid ligase II